MSPYAQRRLSEFGRRPRRRKLPDYEGRRWAARLTTYGDINALLKAWAAASQPIR